MITDIKNDFATPTEYIPPTPPPPPTLTAFSDAISYNWAFREDQDVTNPQVLEIDAFGTWNEEYPIIYQL